MNTSILRSIALAGALGSVASGLLAKSARAQAVAQIAKNDPCKLVTQPEIKAALQAKRDASSQPRSLVWLVDAKSTTMGDARVCRIHWQGTLDAAGRDMAEKGDMTLTVFDGEIFKANVSDLNRTRKRNGRPPLSQIPDFPNEAYFFGYSEKGNPEARVGDVAVGIEFLTGKPSVDLLRAAVKRVAR